MNQFQERPKNLFLVSLRFQEFETSENVRNKNKSVVVVIIYTPLLDSFDSLFSHLIPRKNNLKRIKKAV